MPAIAEDIGRRFDFVLVDEYQDTNALQAKILLGLKPDGRGLTVVGDDAQSIYGFRAATVRNILEFPSAFEPPAAVLKLEQNYRSTQPILDAANAVMAGARDGFTKSLFSTRRSAQKPWLAMVADPTGEVDYVVRSVLANREAGTELREQAVLFRTSHHSGELEVELRRRNIPFVKYGGLKFLELAHVKDLLALLRWAENPRDRIAAFRFLQLMPGIGPGTARKVLTHLEAAGFRFEALARFSPPRAAADLWPELTALMPALTGREIWAGQLELARRFYDPLLEERYDFARARLADLDELVRLAASYRSRQQFLTELTLDPPAAAGDEAGPAAAGRGLSDPLDHPLGQRSGMAGGLRPARGRRLHPLRHGDRLGRGSRGRTPPALRRDDPRARSAAPDPAAPLLHHQPGALWRPLRHGAALALHPGSAAPPLRSWRVGIAAGGAGRGSARALADGRHRGRAARHVGLRAQLGSGPESNPRACG